MNQGTGSGERGAAGHEPGPPPIGGTWNRLYLIVLGELALLVVLFYWFTKVYE